MTQTERASLLEKLDETTSGVPWTPTRVCHLLFDLALTFEQPQILEVSCGYGKATTYLAAAAKARGGHVYSVDHARPTWSARTAVDLLTTVGVAESCDVTFDTDARWYLLDLLTKRPGEWLDLVYIDAAHCVEVDSFIALAAWVHLKPGGLLVFDDLNWTAERHGPDAPFSRPSIAHVRTIYEYVSSLPGVNEAREWGEVELEWPWGFLQKEAPKARKGHGIADLFARLPSIGEEGKS